MIGVRLLADATVNCLTNGVCNTGLPKVEASSANLQQILQLTFGVIGAAAVITIMIAGLRFVTARGNPQAVAGARQAILFAVIGLVVALSAEVIVTFVLKSV